MNYESAYCMYISVDANSCTITLDVLPCSDAYLILRSYCKFTSGHLSAGGMKYSRDSYILGGRIDP